MLSVSQRGEAFVNFQAETPLLIIPSLFVQRLDQRDPVTIFLLPSFDGFTKVLSRFFKPVVEVLRLSVIRTQQGYLELFFGSEISRGNLSHSVERLDQLR